MTKKLILLTVLFMGLVLNSCTKVAQQLAQTLGWAGVDVTITVPPQSDTTNQNVVGTGTFTYNLDSLIKSKTGGSFGLSNIDNFTLSSCVLTITDPVGDTANSFGNFQMAAASFSTNANGTVANIGEVDNNPAGYNVSLTVPVNNTTNLRSYVPTTGPVIVTYQLKGKLRTATTVPITINAHVTYDIHVIP
jgi:hypothetical protein